MHVEHLTLDEFRTYRHLDLDIPPAGLRLIGKNGSGKTSVLEALVMLSSGRSSRASVDRDVIAWESGEDYGVPPYARWEADVRSESGRHKVGLSIEIDRAGPQRKQFLIDGERVRAADHVGTLKSILFSPEDVMLVSGSPSERRRQVDILLSQVDRNYLRALSAYTRVLAQRNHLLKQFTRERRSPRDGSAVNELSFWDEQLIDSGSTVIAARTDISQAMTDLVGVRSRDLIADRTIGFAYQPRLEGLDPSSQPSRNQIAALFQDAIASRRIDEFRRGMTLMGPHRDDFTFTIDERDLAQFGSRGQQRLGVIAYRLAEIDTITTRSGETPILLLDDVLSELDDVHRDMLITTVSHCGCQILITATDQTTLGMDALAPLPMATVTSSSITIAGGD